MRSRTIRGRSLLTAATIIAAGAVPAAGATSAIAAPQCPIMSKAVREENRASARLVQRLEDDSRYRVTRRTFTPKISRTRGFTGFGSVVVRAPRGTAPVAGVFRLRGEDECAIKITSASVVLRRNAYVVRFKAPGEQGDPGRIAVTLLSV